MTRFLAVLAVLALASPAEAAPEVRNRQETERAIRGTGQYGVAGCGLGSLAFGNTEGPVQLFAATTNGWTGTQIFGITTGTSNCGPGLFAMGTKNFVEANREALAKDISRGGGEAIGALTVINACEDSRKVGAALQQAFGAIFPSPAATNDEIAEAILKTLHADPALGCG